MNHILCSTSTFINKQNSYDHSLIFDLRPNLKYQGFEIFMFDYYADHPDEYESVAKKILYAKENGAVFYTMHMNKRISNLLGSNDYNQLNNSFLLFESNCKYAVEFGAKMLVLHLWGGRSSIDSIELGIKLFPKFKEISDKYNLTLTIENIVCNSSNPLDHMKRLWQLYPNDIKFTIDVRQAEFHKSLVKLCESSFLWENNLVPHIHLSDFSGGYMDWAGLHNSIPLSKGDVDFDYFFIFLKTLHFNGTIVSENEMVSNDNDIVNELNYTYDFIKRHLD